MVVAIILVKLTRDGKTNIKDAPKRVEGARKAVESFGGKWIDIYATLGAYDYVAITEFPDVEKVLATAAAVSATGTVELETLIGVGESSWKDIVEMLP